uniref:RNase H type-1 domain-containing protein n=1 Tax=Aegilops tauschii subsp. strangulata TaxID=200361 RepID=A0A453MCY5_AEGTS
LIDSLSHELFVKLSVTLWAIWAARRKAIHEGIFQSPQAIHGFISRYLAELSILAEPQERKQRAPPTTTTTIQRPKAPLPGHAKVHVDAACRKGLGGSVAAVCRGETGAYLGSSSLVIAGVDDPEILETIACREGLAMAQDLNINNLVIASDSKGVVGAINNKSQGSSGAIITEIHSRVISLNCVFTFEGRAVNVEAHRLAKHAFPLGPGRHIWLGQPHDQRCIPFVFVAFD